MTPAEARAARRFTGPDSIRNDEDATAAAVALEAALDELDAIWFGDGPALVQAPTNVLDVHQGLIDWCRKHHVDPARLVVLPSVVEDLERWRWKTQVWVRRADWDRLAVQVLVDHPEGLAGAVDGVPVWISRAELAATVAGDLGVA